MSSSPASKQLLSARRLVLLASAAALGAAMVVAPPRFGPALNSLTSPAYAQAGNELMLLGDGKGALARVAKAIELSPKDESINVFEYIQGRAYFTLGDYEKAADALGQSVRVRSNLWFVHAWLVAALALCNRDEEAKLAIEGFKKLHGERSDFAAISKHYGQDRFLEPKAQAAVAQLLAGLKKAGVQ